MEAYGTETDTSLRAAGLDAIYVTHYTPFSARRTYMQQTLDALGLNATFITGWDRENLTDADVACMYPSNRLFEEVALKRKFTVSWLRVGELGLAMKHATAYYDAVQRGYNNILVLEDDAVFADGFKVQLEKILHSKDFHRGYDIIFLGSYYGTVSTDEAENPRLLYNAGAKGAVGYLVSQRGARHLMNHMPITGPADHMVSRPEYPNAPPVRFLVEPTLIGQGSRMESWATKIAGHHSFKGDLFVRTNDTGPCQGCLCPLETEMLSPHIVLPLDHTVESLLQLSSRRGLNNNYGLSERYIAALIDAGYACDAEDAIRLERMNLGVNLSNQV